MKTNIFGTILTHAAPSSNNRGESDENLLKIQTLPINGDNYPIVSSLAIRNRLRDVLNIIGAPMNRSRFQLKDNPQPAVKFDGKADPKKYLDDYVFGYVVAGNKSEISNFIADENFANSKSKIQINHAVGLVAYHNDVLLQQYPIPVGRNESNGGGLLSVQTVFTAYQYPFAMEDIDNWKDNWLKQTLSALSQIGSVAGNNSRTFFDFSPRSIVVRLTTKCAPQYNIYGFEKSGEFSDLDIINSNEWYIGGDIVKSLPPEVKDKMISYGVNMSNNCQELLDSIGIKATSSS